MSNFKKNTVINPIIVLVSIGLVASFLLAGVFQVTKPIIDQREQETKNAALKQVLPDATTFSKIEDVELEQYVAEIYKAENGAGYVCSTKCKSQQGGEINLMVGVNALNQVNGISVISHNETAGIGDKVLQEDYFKKYYGISEIDQLDAVDTVSGATKTSSCVKESAKLAVKQVTKIANSDNPTTDMTYEEKVVTALNDLFKESSNTTKIEVEAIEGVKEVYKAGNGEGYGVVVEQGNVIAMIAVKEDGTVTGNKLIESEADETLLKTLSDIAVEQVNKIK